MQSFEKTLKYFREKEEPSLHKYVLQKMSQVAAERRYVLLHRNITGARKKPVPIPCISKTLFDTSPRSNFFLLQIYYNLVHLTFIYLSKFVLGQFMITVLDYYMIKLEKTLDFCVPQDMSMGDIGEMHRKTLTVTDRPLTWIFFIPALIWLRVFRFWLSAASIIMGRGEVTAKQMQMKIVTFRRYYRSIRHYAVVRYTKDELNLKEERCTGSLIWRIIYNIYERIVMIKPPVEFHSNMPNESNGNGSTSHSNQIDNGVGLGSGRPMKKNSLNEIDDDDSSDDDLNTQEKLDEYAKQDDNVVSDPDYVPVSEPSSDEISISSDVDTEEEKTESQKQLNDEGTPNLSGKETHDGYSSDTNNREKSKNDESFTFTEKQLAELENQLVKKILKHFKDNFNYEPAAYGPANDDVFYSPIGSPPEKGYSSDSEIPSVSRNIEHVKNNQVQEISSTHDKSSATETLVPNNQVAQERQ